MKIKILSANSTQQTNVITKCRNWGAAARDGDYGPVPGKTAVVINTKLGGGSPAIQLSRLDFTPTKKPYDQEISYKDFMNLDTCPWGANASITAHSSCTNSHHNVCSETKTVTEVIAVPIPVDVGVCAQDTLKVVSCSVLEQEPTIWKTIGLPSLQDLGVDVTMADGVAYVINTKKNTAKPLTPKSAAKKAKKAIEANDTESLWAIWARRMDLVTDVTMQKQTEEV